jgi:hypothetical protein
MTLKEKFTTMVLDKDIADWEKECEKITDDYAIEFAKFSINYNYHQQPHNCWIEHGKMPYEKLSSKELLEIFKKKKGL